jgi:Mor family transcriptional regulator
MDADEHPSVEDRIVAEFGAGYDVEMIAARYGLHVRQVYAVVERAVIPPPATSGGPPLDPDAIVAEYSEGHAVEAIARMHGISAEQVYEVVQRSLSDGP